MLEREPSSRFRLRNVNTLFRDIVDNTSCPMVYISLSILNIVLSPVSVRRLIRIARSASGLFIEIKKIIGSNVWHHGWLFLRELENRWYEIVDVRFNKVFKVLKSSNLAWF